MTRIVFMNYVSRWIYLAKENLKLLFRSIYLIYNRYIHLSLKFLSHAKSINIDPIFIIKSLCISQQLFHKKLH